VATENLQTIIISKKLAKTRKQAEKLARPYARKIYTSRETKHSFRFRQRPPSDFIKKSFRSFRLPHKPGIVLVYGKLKRAKNPSQRYLQWRGDDLDVMREWDYWMVFYPQVRKAKTERALRVCAQNLKDRRLKSATIEDLCVSEIADRARILRVAFWPQSVENDWRIYKELLSKEIKNPAKKQSKTKRKTKKKTKKSSKHIKLVSPTVMPDPGPCSWLGSTLEFGWEPDGEKWRKFDGNGRAVWGPRSDWMFLWSPKYKAIVAIKRPRNMYKLAKVERYGSAAKMFEVFAARPAENTFEVDVPEVPLHRIGRKASHIIYRSDKWSAQRKKTDYNHDFKKGVKLYCGPSLKRPEVFLCFGGKLTLTERGLVY